MRRPSPFRRESRSFDASMTPMIDVVFLLLIFFLWTSSFQMAEWLLPSELTPLVGAAPTPADAPPPPELDFDDVVLRLVGNRQSVSWQLNDQPLAGPQETLQRLQAIVGVVPDAPLVIHPDPQIALGTVIDAYDLARLAGFTEIQYAVQESEDAP